MNDIPRSAKMYELIIITIMILIMDFCIPDFGEGNPLNLIVPLTLNFSVWGIWWTYIYFYGRRPYLRYRKYRKLISLDKSDKTNIKTMKRICLDKLLPLYAKKELINNIPSELTEYWKSALVIDKLNALKEDF